MNDIKPSSADWWGKYSLSENEAGVWRIGPAVFRIERLPGEWRIVCETDEKAAEDTVDVSLPVPIPGECGPGETVTRFGMAEKEKAIYLKPAMADRPVVIQSEVPFYIMPNQRINFYVSTPLWICIEAGKTPTRMVDKPIVRPSDTWFGPSTMQGELCYSSTTSGRLRLEDIIFRPHRAVTVVLLHNGTGASVLLKSLNLPVQNLSLYESEGGFLWTQPVKLDMKTDVDSAELGLKQRAPSEAKNSKLICEPRIKPVQNILTHTLTRLIK